MLKIFEDSSQVVYSNLITQFPFNIILCFNLQVQISCECGLRKASLQCSENDREYRAVATSMLASQMQNMNNGCTVDLSEIFTATARPDKLKRCAIVFTKKLFFHWLTLFNSYPCPMLFKTIWIYIG